MFNKFFKTHSEIALTGLAILFLATIAALYFWGTRVLFQSLNKATTIGSGGAGAETSFNLDGARSLDIDLSR